MSFARCRSCGADMEWATSPAGSKLPIDPGAVTGRAPIPLDVVVHVPSGRGMVLRADSIRDGQADEWLAAKGCELRTSHWETCPGSANHRAGAIRPGQEVMEL